MNVRASIVVVFCVTVLATVTHGADKPESYWNLYFRGMKEPILPSAKVADEDFHVRWTRLSYSGEPLSIRVSRTNGRMMARAVRLQYRYDYSVGRITCDQTIQLTDKQVAHLLSLLRDSAFWRGYRGDPYLEGAVFLDGARWLFELQDSSGYHFVSLFSPALLAGDAQSHYTASQRRRFRRYIALATFLLRTTEIFPAERQASY